MSGWDGEEKDSPGVALLTRQVIFRGEGGIPLVEAVNRAGGVAVAITESRRTYFRANVPSIKSSWMLNELSKALMPREISLTLLEQAKAEALETLGEPAAPGLDLFALLLQTYFVPPDFFQSEFGIMRRPRSAEFLRLQLPTLSMKQVQNYFYTHYTPSNMALFIAGPLKKKEILNFVRETYGAYPDRGRPPISPIIPRPRHAPFVRSRRAVGSPSVAIGTKFDDITPERELVLRAYLKSLAHRLNATVFAKSPEAERVVDEISLDPARFGYGRIRFRAPADRYSQLRTQVEEQIDAEARGGMLSEEEINQALEYYLTDLEREAEGTEANLAYAERFFAFRSMYRTEQSPFEILQTMRAEDFRKHLATVFVESNRYLQLEEPPALFEGEAFVLCVLTALLTLWLWRRWLRRDFQHTHLHYLRRIRYGWTLGTFLGLGYCSILWVLLQGGLLLERYCYRLTLIQSTYWLNGYAKAVIGIFLAGSYTLGFLSWFPRKLMVVGEELILKSPTYYSVHVPIGEIKEVYVVTPWQVLVYNLWRPSLRIQHWMPWKQGLLIRFRDGTGYYLGFKNADLVGRELKEVLNALRQRPSRMVHHQILRTRS